MRNELSEKSDKSQRGTGQGRFPQPLQKFHPLPFPFPAGHKMDSRETGLGKDITVKKEIFLATGFLGTDVNVCLETVYHAPLSK